MDSNNFVGLLLVASICLFPALALYTLQWINKTISKLLRIFLVTKIKLQKHGWYGMILLILHLNP